MLSLLLFSWLTFLHLEPAEGTLLIQSCVQLGYIKNLNPSLFPTSGSLQLYFWVDNDRSTIKYTPAYTWENVTNGTINLNDEQYCWIIPRKILQQLVLMFSYRMS